MIRHLDGRLEQVLLLSVTGSALRILRPGSDDTAECTVHTGTLRSEANEPVEIEFIGFLGLEGPQTTWVAAIGSVALAAEPQALAN